MRANCRGCRWVATPCTARGGIGVHAHAQLRRELILIGRETIVEESADAFAKQLSIGPYIPPPENMRDRIKARLTSCPRPPMECSVLAIFLSTGGGKGSAAPPLCMAFIDAKISHELL